MWGFLFVVIYVKNIKQRLLKMYHPVIIVESEARHCGKDNVIALFDLIKNNGYNGFFYNGESLESIDKFDIEKYQLNIYKKNKMGLFIEQF